MRSIIEGGATTILVSHSLPQIKELCNKVLWLDHGHQIAFSVLIKYHGFPGGHGGFFLHVDNGQIGFQILFIPGGCGGFALQRQGDHHGHQNLNDENC